MDAQFIDRSDVSGVRITADGYLVADVRCARTGCQTYRAAEMGMTGDVVTIFRPEAAVFNRDSMATFVGKPVTMGHPPEPVNSDNWRKYAVGDIGEEIARDGEYVRVSIKLMDAAAIQAVRDGTREISMGYSTAVEIIDGVAPDGTKYQAVQTGPIRINHLAIVPTARGGANLRVGDAEKWGLSPVTESEPKEGNMSDALKTVVLGDKAVQVALADTATIEGFKTDTANAMLKVVADHDKAIAIKDAELAAKDAEIAKLKGQVIDGAALDAKVQERADLITKAKSIVADVATTGKTDAEIRKAVVIAKRGASVADKSEAYIDAAFDLLLDTQADPVAKVLADGRKVTDINTAYAKRDTELSNAWKPKKEG